MATANLNQIAAPKAQSPLRASILDVPAKHIRIECAQLHMSRRMLVGRRPNERVFMTDALVAILAEIPRDAQMATTVVFRRQMGIGVDGCLYMRVPQPPLHIGRVPSSPKEIGCMRVTEHMRRRVQPCPLRELAEQIDGSRVPHRSADMAAPPVHED